MKVVIELNRDEVLSILATEVAARHGLELWDCTMSNRSYGNTELVFEHTEVADATQGATDAHS